MGYKINKKSTNQKIFRDSQRIKNKTVRYQAKENRKINRSTKICSEDKNIINPYPCKYLSYNTPCMCHHLKLFKRLLDNLPGYQCDYPSIMDMKIKKKLFCIPKMLYAIERRVPLAKDQKVPSLPGPVWSIIFSFCKIRTLMSLEMVSKRFHNLVNLTFKVFGLKSFDCCDYCYSRLKFGEVYYDCYGRQLKFEKSSFLNNYCDSCCRLDQIPQKTFSQMKDDFRTKVIHGLKIKHMNLIKIIIEKNKALSFLESLCVMCRIPQMKKSYDIIQEILIYKNSPKQKENRKAWYRDRDRDRHWHWYCDCDCEWDREF